MRIALMVRNLTEGGAERVASLWAAGFYKRGHVVEVIISDKNAPITYSLPEGVILSNVFFQHHNKLYRFAGNILSLRKELKAFGPDVIIDVSPRWMRRIAMVGVSGVKISTEHWSFERPANAVMQPKKINKIYLNRLYDFVTVLTQADKDVIGNQLKHVAVLPNPLSLKPAVNLPKKENIILAAGRLDGWHVKGFDVLIKAWSMACEEAKGWRLQIAGGGSDKSKEYLKKMCKNEHVEDRVDFLGYQSEIQPYFAKASVFVLSSRYEGFGLVLIEAMSQGCACVACDFKGRQKEIIKTDAEGVICEPENEKALCNAILSLVKNEEKRKQIGEHSIIRSKDYCIDKIMERWDKILNNLI